MGDYSELKAKVLARFEGCDYVPGGPPVFVWHMYHDTLVETLQGPIVERVDRIIARKSACEIEIRLEWLWPVKSKLPDRFVKAEDDYLKARPEFVKVRDECAAELEAIHAAELPRCAWDGKQLVFPPREMTDG